MNEPKYSELPKSSRNNLMQESYTSLQRSRRNRSIAFLIALCLLSLLFVLVIVGKKDKPVIIKGNDSIVFIQSDSIPVLDQKILDRLVKPLKAREGYSDSVYSDKKGFLYIGYGHLLTKTYPSRYPVNFNNLTVTEAQADSILRIDIRASFNEVQRIERKELFHKIYSVFISGKP